MYLRLWVWAAYRRRSFPATRLPSPQNSVKSWAGPFLSSIPPPPRPNENTNAHLCLTPRFFELFEILFSTHPIPKCIRYQPAAYRKSKHLAQRRWHVELLHKGRYWSSGAFVTLRELWSSPRIEVPRPTHSVIVLLPPGGHRMHWNRSYQLDKEIYLGCGYHSGCLHAQVSIPWHSLSNEKCDWRAHQNPIRQGLLLTQEACLRTRNPAPALWLPSAELSWRKASCCKADINLTNESWVWWWRILVAASSNNCKCRSKVSSWYFDRPGGQPWACLVFWVSCMPVVCMYIPFKQSRGSAAV